MLESLRQKISKLSLGLKFIIRVTYPVLLYILFYFLLHKTFRTQLQTTQLLFIFLWTIIEWQVFFKKPSK